MRLVFEEWMRRSVAPYPRRLRSFFGVIAFAILLSVAAGCLPDSIHALFTEKDLVEEDWIVGNWNTDLKVEAIGRKNYELKVADPALEDLEPPSKCRIFRLGAHYFIDLEAASGVHNFARIAILGDKLYIRSLYEGWLEERFLKSPKELAHRNDRSIVKLLDDESYIEEKLILTADTADLQAFVMKHIDDPAAFGREGTFLSKKGGVPIQASGLASTKYRTFNYWYEVRMAIRTVSIGGKARPKVVAATLEKLARSISGLPTAGVDRAAVECVTDTANAFNSLAAVILASKDGGEWIEAYGRKFEGDPFGVATAQMRAPPPTKEQLASCLTRFDKNRVLLTERYEMEFPAIQ